jgi:hypothetical protein
MYFCVHTPLIVTIHYHKLWAMFSGGLGGSVLTSVNSPLLRLQPVVHITRVYLLTPPYNFLFCNAAICTFVITLLEMLTCYCPVLCHRRQGTSSIMFPEPEWSPLLFSQGVHYIISNFIIYYIFSLLMCTAASKSSSLKSCFTIVSLRACLLTRSPKASYESINLAFLKFSRRRFFHQRFVWTL